jgi:hypothetical protein
MIFLIYINHYHTVLVKKNILYSLLQIKALLKEIFAHGFINKNRILCLLYGVHGLQGCINPLDSSM